MLNRNIRITEQGYAMEADPRHAELIIAQIMGKGSSMHRTVTSPGIDNEDKTRDDNDTKLEGQEANMFRSNAARCLYISLGRPGLQLSVH